MKGECYLTGCLVKIGDNPGYFTSCPEFYRKEIEFLNVPVVYRDIPELLQKISKNDRNIKLDTRFFHIDTKNCLSEAFSKLSDDETFEILEEVVSMTKTGDVLTPEQILSLLEVIRR
jgi:hypothetical protein